MDAELSRRGLLAGGAGSMLIALPSEALAQSKDPAPGASSKPRYKFLVLSNPVEGSEAEYNDWYDNQHLADVVKVPGIVAAQRFRLEEGTGVRNPHRYLAIYELETDDVAAVRAELNARARTAAMPISPAIDQSTLAVGIFKPIGKPVSRD